MQSMLSVIFSGIVIFQIIIMNILFTGYAVDLGNKFEEDRLRIAVNYATDAAANEMIVNSANLGQDYEAIAKINVDPAVAMDTFATIICKNYDIPVSNINKQNILMSYVPVFMVAGYDGYFVANRETINTSGVQNLIISPKMPYLYQVEEIDGTITDYSINMSLDNQIKVDGYGNVSKVYGTLDEDTQLSIINNTLSDALNAKLLENSPLTARGTMYIPAAATTIGSTNTIKNTTVFAYIDNFDLHGKNTDLQSFAIGGTEIKNNSVVVGFELLDVYGTLQKYYCYSEDLPGGVTPVETFNTQIEAAQAGYYAYVE